MTKVYDKPNSIGEVSSILEAEKPSSILLVTGNASYDESPIREELEAQLDDYSFIRYKGLKKYPTTESVANIADIINKASVDFIIAIGGGTVIDNAKAASILSFEEGDVTPYVEGKEKPEGKNIPRLFIPTTAGTGAEITPFAVVYVDKTKYSLAHPSMAPEYVILDDRATLNLPPRITAATGCDALSQCIEAFWSVNATKESKEYSAEGIKLVLENLETAVNNPTPDARRNMLIASHLSGKAIAIAKTTAAHALSYPLTSYHGVAHGHAVMLTLPYFFEVNEKIDEDSLQDKEGFELDYARSTFSELLEVLGVRNGSDAQEKLTALVSNIGLETKLSALGITEGDFDNIIANGFNPQRVKNNPVFVTEEIERDILARIK